MELILIVLRNTVQILILALQLAMFIRAIFSWFPMDENKFTDFLYAVTEPIVAPVRRLFERMNWFRGFPLDMSFLVTYIIISTLIMILSR